LNLEERGRYDKEWPEAFDDNLTEAARCLSVSFWSGAMPFTVRAVEAGIKHYFTLTTGESPGIDPWGKLITRLKNFDAKKQLIEAIERLKTRYRDPIAHITETNLTFDEITTLKC
jgi:HEPN domain-containing protein